MATLAIVENLFIVLDFLLDPNYTSDYRYMCVYPLFSEMHDPMDY